MARPASYRNCRPAWPAPTSSRGWLQLRWGQTWYQVTLASPGGARKTHSRLRWSPVVAVREVGPASTLTSPAPGEQRAAALPLVSTVRGAGASRDGGATEMDSQQRYPVDGNGGGGHRGPPNPQQGGVRVLPGPALTPPAGFGSSAGRR